MNNKYKKDLVDIKIGFEKVINEQITQFQDEKTLFSRTHFGFRSKFSATDALLFTTENIRYAFDKDRPLAAALLDLSKAFDSISHEYLLTKLKDLNFEVPTLSFNHISLIESRKLCSRHFLTGHNCIKVFHKVL